MGKRLLLIPVITIMIGFANTRLPAQSSPAWLDPYRDPAARLIGEATGDTFAWNRLSVLTDSIGNRLSGSPQLERAIEWSVAEMKRDGLENVHTEKVMVPHWVRGNESAEIVEPAHHPMVMLGLGNSAGTRPEGVQAEVLTVHGFNELEAAGPQAKGKIVFFNVSVHLRGDGDGTGRTGRRGRPGWALRPCWSGPSVRQGCGRRTPARCSTRRMRHGFPPRRSRPRTLTASSASRRAAAAWTCD